MHSRVPLGLVVVEEHHGAQAQSAAHQQLLREVRPHETRAHDGDAFHALITAPLRVRHLLAVKPEEQANACQPYERKNEIHRNHPARRRPLAEPVERSYNQQDGRSDSHRHE